MNENLHTPIQSEEERKRRYDQITNSNFLAEARNKTRQSSWILAGIGIINLGYGLWFYFGQNDIISAILQIIIALGYIALAFYARKEPYKAILGGIILYGSLILLNALADPSSILQGIILKIVIIMALVKGMQAGKEVKELEGKLSNVQTDRKVS